MSLNPNPVVYAVKPTVKRRRHDNGDLLHLGDSLVTSVDVDDADLAAADARDAVDAAEVFELIRHLADPEHPLTLEQLHVVRAEHIHVEDQENHIFVQFTPTIPHCSMATLIGLCLRVKLHRSLPSRFKASCKVLIDVKIFPGTHASEVEINRQLNDKERVAAALENTQLSGVVTKCIANTDPLDEIDEGPISLSSTNFSFGLQLAV